MRIVLAGAYGYTAQLIAELLNTDKIPFSVAGKDEVKLSELKKRFQYIERTVPVDLRNAERVKEFVSEFDVFINCAGPFTEEAPLLLEKVAASKNKVYLDITGESEFVRESFKKFHQAALNNNTLVIHANAFESFLADLTSEIGHVIPGEVKSSLAYYYFNHSKPSPGTRMTMKLSRHRSFHKMYEGKWIPLDHMADRREVMHHGQEMIAIPYPLPEIIFFHQNLDSANTLSYLLLSKEAARFMGEKAEESIPVLEELDQLKKKNFSGPTPEQRSSQEFEIRVDYVLKNGAKISVSLSGSDMYALTARLVQETIQQVCKGVTAKGVISPATFHKGRAADILKRLHVSASVVPST